MSARVTQTNGLNVELAAQVEEEIACLNAGFQADFDAETLRRSALRDAQKSSFVSTWFRFFRKGA